METLAKILAAEAKAKEIKKEAIFLKQQIINNAKNLVNEENLKQEKQTNEEILKLQKETKKKLSEIEKNFQDEIFEVEKKIHASTKKNWDKSLQMVLDKVFYDR